MHVPCFVLFLAVSDGKQVTSSGRVASCMECHRDAPRDRLFGFFPPRKPKPATAPVVEAGR